MNITNSVAQIKNCIDEISSSFHDTSYLFFNESDLQSYLFSLLLKDFNAEYELNTSVWGTDKPKKVNKIITRRLHSEFLLPDGRVDLAVLDLNAARFAVNSKGRNPGIRINKGNHAFIEIKASQTSRSIISKSQWKKLIIKDIYKLNKYENISFMLCFDYSNILNENEIELIRQKANVNVELHYIKNSYKKNHFSE